MADNLSLWLAHHLPHEDPPIKLAYVGLIDAVTYGRDANGYYHATPLQECPSKWWIGSTVENHFESKGWNYSGTLFGLVHGVALTDPNAMNVHNVPEDLQSGQRDLDHSGIAVLPSVLNTIEQKLDEVLEITQYG